ncbi:SNF2 helicase associated domain-containing protein [Paenibacillus sp. WLX2291]|uniref:DEAD/DEAH box helicase n=1 Tax=Paenibacillus sp. WLX2291 TaxID=3296934 RepID=UPI0039840C12
MSQQLRLSTIQQWCGKTSYTKGMSYYRDGKVGFTMYDDHLLQYEADVQVKASEIEHVSLRMEEGRDVQAVCTCPTLSSYRYYCQHIAAVLIHVHESRLHQEPPQLIAPRTAESTSTSATATRNRAKRINEMPDDHTRRTDLPDENTRAIVHHPIHRSVHSTNENEAHAAGDLSAMNEQQLASELLTLFAGPPQRAAGRRRYLETRDELAVQFICRPVAYGNGQYRLGIEMKAGPKRLYVVRQLRSLLESIRRRESYPLTARFSYDPELHSFTYADNEVIRHLLQIAEDEQPDEAYSHNNRQRRTSASIRTSQWDRAEGSNSYTRAIPLSTQANKAGKSTLSAINERMLIIPVSHWHSLLVALRQCPSARIAVGEQDLPLLCQQGMLPLHFALDAVKTIRTRNGNNEQSKDDRRSELVVRGLQSMIVLEAYGAVLNGAELWLLDEDLCRRLSRLQTLLHYSNEQNGEQRLTLSPEQLEPFVQQVIPGLMKLGTVQLTRGVSDRIVQTPLQARLYLDRVRDRLLAGLEFQYGDVVLNPLEPEQGKDEQERILLRDGEREEQILQIMEEAEFTATEGGYFLTDEDAEYEFLYRTVPKLEKLLHVYATSIVKTRIQHPLSAPRLSVHTDHRHDWLDFKFQLDGIPEAAIVEVLQSLKEQRRYHRLPNGSFLPLEDEAFQQVADFIRKTGMALPDDVAEPLEQGILFKLPVIYGIETLDVQDENEYVRFDRSVRRLLDSIKHPGRHDDPVPPSLEPILRDYQHAGYQWMRTLARYGFGGILADDMGLGKTLQSIAFILSMADDIRRSGRPVLVVTPSSLVYNWQYELNRFAPELKVLLIDGSKEVRTERWQQVLSQEPDTYEQNVGTEQQPFDVIVTSYPLLRRDIEWASTHAYHTLIVDEAQNFKNALTQTARAVSKIQAKHRFALTGTPIENSAYELWSIMHVIMPKLLGTRKYFADLDHAVIAARIRPFVLRRMKSQVLHELPDKQETTLVSELLPEQKTLYAAYLAQLQQDALEHLHEKNFAENQIRILAGLTRLRQLCCDPSLFVEGYEGSSAKLEQLLEVVQDYRDSGRRMLIFSQFTSMLKIIGNRLREQQTSYFYLDGNTPSAERLELCQRFNEGEQDVFLISLKAGGTGLNLTGADTVILYDLWWNPAVEEQAADRAHRMGQRNKVQVIRLVARGTVEETMLELQQTKKELVQQMIQPGQAKLSALTEQDIRELLMI